MRLTAIVSLLCPTCVATIPWAGGRHEHPRMASLARRNYGSILRSMTHALRPWPASCNSVGLIKPQADCYHLIIRAERTSSPSQQSLTSYHTISFHLPPSPASLRIRDRIPGCAASGSHRVCKPWAPLVVPSAITAARTSMSQISAPDAETFRACLANAKVSCWR